jgi:hypothetical protein
MLVVEEVGHPMDPEHWAEQEVVEEGDPARLV